MSAYSKTHSESVLYVRTPGLRDAKVGGTYGWLPVTWEVWLKMFFMSGFAVIILWYIAVAMASP